jgi:hypothetical protein
MPENHIYMVEFSSITMKAQRMSLPNPSGWNLILPWFSLSPFGSSASSLHRVTKSPRDLTLSRTFSEGPLGPQTMSTVAHRLRKESSDTASVLGNKDSVWPLQAHHTPLHPQWKPAAPQEDSVNGVQAQHKVQCHKKLPNASTCQEICFPYSHKPHNWDSLLTP